MPGFHRGEHSPSADPSEFHFTGRALTDQRARPCPVGAPFQCVQSFFARGHDLVLRIGVEAERYEVVLNVVGLTGHFHRPWIRSRVGRGSEDEQTGARTIPVRSFRALPMQRRDDELLLAIAVDVRPSDAMQRRLREDRKDLPRGRRAGGILPDPLQRAGVLTSPSGAERDIETAVPVDIVRRERDVVGRRRTRRQG